MSLYSNYTTGSAMTPQYTAAREYFDHGGKLLGLHKERDTNNGLNQLTSAIQRDMAQLKMEVAQQARRGTPGSSNPNLSPRLYVSG